MTSDDAIAERVRSLRHHGALDGDFPLVGYNYRMSDINAAVGVAQLRRLHQIIAARREIACLYARGLSGIAGLMLPGDQEGADHTYQSYVVSLDNRFDRNRTIAALKEKGIEAGIGTYAIHGLKYYKEKSSIHRNRLSRSAKAYQQTLTLPLFPEMTPQEVQYVCENLRAILGGTAQEPVTS